MQWLLFLVAVSIGAAISFADSRPGWDDTGITAMAVFLACAVLSFISPGRFWLWPLAVGLWIPATAIMMTQNYGSLLALAFAFAGAGGGVAIRSMLAPISASRPKNSDDK